MAVPTLRCVLAALVLSACTAGSGPEPAAPESPTRPNFLVIDIDSFGADWLLAERDGARIAPTMTMLASRSQRFTRAISQAGWTLPAAYSLLTGHYPLLLNVVDNTHPAWDGNTRSLAETLGYYGYRSVAYWGHTSLGPNQLGRGFGSTATTEEGDYTVPLSAWIAEEPERPFFAYVHNIDLHYAPIPTAALHLYEPAIFGCTGGHLMTEEYEAIVGKVGDAAAHTHMVAHYEARIHAFDAVVADLLNQLGASGVANDTVIVLTSDHGEDLGDHVMYAHSVLFDTVLRIPLLIWDPTRKPGEVDTMVQTIDLAPTILARAGIPADRTMDGQSLLPLMQPESPADGSYEERVVYSVTTTLTSARTRTSKGIRASVAPGAGSGRRFYDLLADPGERHALDEAAPGAAALFAGLEAWHEERAIATGLVPRVELLEAQKKDLQQRGYFQLLDKSGTP